MILLCGCCKGGGLSQLTHTPLCTRVNTSCLERGREECWARGQRQFQILMAVSNGPPWGLYHPHCLRQWMRLPTDTASPTACPLAHLTLRGKPISVHFQPLFLPVSEPGHERPRPRSTPLGTVQSSASFSHGFRSRSQCEYSSATCTQSALPSLRDHWTSLRPQRQS